MALIRLTVPNSSEYADLTFEVLSASRREVLASTTATEYVEGGWEANFPGLTGHSYLVNVLNGEVSLGLFIYKDSTPLTEEEAVYKGVWDALNNTPEIPELYEGEPGDFYFVSNSGTTSLGGSSVWSSGDRVIWDGSAWQKIRKSTTVDANSRMVCLNTETAIFADGEHPVRDPDGRAGWRYTNTAGNKINWYLWSELQHIDFSLNQFEGVYMVIEIKTEGSMPYWTVYTKPQGDGNDESWFRSRINYIDEAASAALPAGRYLFHTSNFDPSGIEPDLPRLSLPVGSGTVGPQDSSEELWLMSLSTSSNYPAGTNDFLVEKVGVQVNGSIGGIELAAVDTRPVYTDFFLGSYDSPEDYPSNGDQGQWIIDSTDNTMLVWDTDGGSWVATGSGAEAPSSSVADYPFQYVYSSLDGSGYGFMNAHPANDWSNTPDGKIQATGYSTNILGRRIKFATLKNIGDEVTIQSSDNTTAYYRYCVIGLEAGTDADSLSWKVAGQPSSGTSWMMTEASDRAKVEMYTAYIEPYWGGTSYGHNMTGRRNSSGLAGMLSNHGEKPVTFRVGSDYRIEMYIDGHYFVKTSNVPTTGVDLYYTMYGNTGRILNQPTGNGLNYVGGTSPNATGARYFMSSVGTPAGATELESNGVNYLYSDTDAGHPSDIELTDTEAAAARFCRVFKDFTGLTLDERADWMHPVVEADRTALNEVEHIVTGYYHSLDLSIPEIQNKMAMWADGLAAAKAGSVELTLALTQSLLAPVASGGTLVDFDPWYVSNGSTSSDIRMSASAGDAIYDDHGIHSVRFYRSGPSLGQIEFAFVDSASTTAWRSQDREMVLDYPDGTESFEGSFTMTSADEFYSNAGQVTYSNPDGWDSQKIQDLAAVLVSEGLGDAAGIQISLGAVSAQSVAGALSETDVVNRVIADLTDHLQKFPR